MLRNFLHQCECAWMLEDTIFSRLPQYQVSKLALLKTFIEHKWDLQLYPRSSVLKTYQKEGSH
jgi:hypothetical protein